MPHNQNNLDQSRACSILGVADMFLPPQRLETVTGVQRVVTYRMDGFIARRHVNLIERLPRRFNTGNRRRNFDSLSRAIAQKYLLEYRRARGVRDNRPAQGSAISSS